MLLSDFDGLGQSLPAQGGPHLPGNRLACNAPLLYGDKHKCTPTGLFGLDGLVATKGGPMLPGSEGGFNVDQRIFGVGLDGLGQGLPAFDIGTFDTVAMIARTLRKSLMPGTLAGFFCSWVSVSDSAS